MQLYGRVFCKVYENHLNAENLLYSRSPGNAALHDTRDRHLHPYVSFSNKYFEQMLYEFEFLSSDYFLCRCGINFPLTRNLEVS